MGLISWDLQTVLRALTAGVTPPELEAAKCDPMLLRSARRIAALVSRITEIKARIENVERFVCKLQSMQAMQTGVEVAELKTSNWDPESVKLAHDISELKALVQAWTPEARNTHRQP